MLNFKLDEQKTWNIDFEFVTGYKRIYRILLTITKQNSYIQPFYSFYNQYKLDLQ
jgi:hypothetical protein